MIKRNYLAFLFALVVSILSAQQSHVNVQWDPQRNSENILPFSCRTHSPEVHDDRTVTFRLIAPNANEVLLTGSMFVGQDARKRVPLEKGDRKSVV